MDDKQINEQNSGSDHEPRKKESETSYVGYGVSLGLCFGAALGMLFGNLSMGAGIGLCFGIVVGTTLDAKKK